MLLAEAGVTVTDLFGRPLDLAPESWRPGRLYRAVAANPSLHAQLLEVIDEGATSDPDDTGATPRLA